MDTRFLCVIATLVFLSFSVSAVAKKCPEPGHPSCGGGGGDVSTDAPDSYNLARASFNNFPNSDYSSHGGVSADGVDTCTVPRPGGPSPVTYDYWAWQEELLTAEENIYFQHTGDESDCVPPHNNRSDVSGGGRWFLITTAGPEPLPTVERWLVFDFSDGLDGYPCPDLDGDSPGSTPIYETDLNPDDINPCLDHLTVRLPADRILKSNATQQDLEISIRYKPPGNEYWPPWGSIKYLEPLYIRKPSDFGPFEGRDCTVMSTRPAPTENNTNPEHDKMAAELYSWIGPSSSEYKGKFNMPLEVCVIRTSD